MSRELSLHLEVDRFISLIIRSQVIRNPQSPTSLSDEVHRRKGGFVLYTLNPKGKAIGRRFIPSDSREE